MKNRKCHYFFRQDPISREVCRYFHLTHYDVVSDSRRKHVATARHLIRCLLVMSGRKPYHMERDGYGSHANTYKSCCNIQNWCATDKDFRITFANVKDHVERQTGLKFAC